MKLVVVSVLFPSAKPFFDTYFQSIADQEDQEFLWHVYLDGVYEGDIPFLSQQPDRIEICPKGLTPVEIREYIVRCEHEGPGSHLCFADVDDIMLPNKTAMMKQVLGHHEMAFHDMETIDGSGRVLTASYFEGRYIPDETQITDLLHRNYIGLSNMGARKDILYHALPFPKNFILADWWFAMIACLQGVVPKKITTGLIQYRQHGDNFIGDNQRINEHQLKQAIEIKKRHLRALSSRKELSDNLRNDVKSYLRKVMDLQETLLIPTAMEQYIDWIAKQLPSYTWWEFVNTAWLERNSND